jgi:hypothetical protein
MNPQNTVVVVSVYNKPIPWADKLRGIGFDVRPYTKEDPSSPYNVPKNVGNEGSAYLKYIIDTYDTLPEYSILLHDHETSYHQEGSILDAIQNKIGTEELFWNFNIPANQEFYLCDASGRINFYNEFLKEYIGPDIYKFGEFILNRKLFAQFLLHKSLIQARPKEMYQRIYNWFMETNLTKFASGFLLEVYWDLIFGQIKEIDYFPKIAVWTDSLVPRDDFLIQYGKDVFEFYTTNPECTSQRWKPSTSKDFSGYNFEIYVNYDTVDLEFYDHILSMLYHYNIVKSNVFLTLSGDPEGKSFYIKSITAENRPLTPLMVNDPDLSRSGFLGTHWAHNPSRFKILPLYDN